MQPPSNLAGNMRLADSFIVDASELNWTSNFEVLTSQSDLGHINALEVYSPDLPAFTDIFKKPAPALRSLVILHHTRETLGNDIWAENANRWIETDSWTIPSPLFNGDIPELKCLILQSVIFSPSTINFAGCNLVHMSIDLSECVSFGLSSPGEWLDVLSTQRNLESLTLRLGIWKARASCDVYLHRQAVNLPRLQEFSLHCDIADAGDILGDMILPSTCVLRIYLTQLSCNQSWDGIAHGLFSYLLSWQGIFGGSISANGVWEIATLASEEEELFTILFHGPQCGNPAIHQVHFNLEFRAPKDILEKEYPSAQYIPPLGDFLMIIREGVSYMAGSLIGVALDMGSPIHRANERSLEEFLDMFTRVIPQKYSYGKVPTDRV